MQFKYLTTMGFASVLLLATFKISTVIPQAEANSWGQSTQLIADNQNSGQLLAQGQFVTVEQNHPTEGQAVITEENGKRYLTFDDNFTTARGPKVKVVLHRNASVPVNIEENDYITIAPLESFDGTQKYLLPDNLNLDEYQSVAIWCEQFNVTFGYAAL